MQAVFGEHKSTKLFYEKGGRSGRTCLTGRENFEVAPIGASRGGFAEYDLLRAGLLVNLRA